MVTDRKRLLFREYLRASKDRHGRQRSVSDQHDDNVRDVTENGWLLGKEYLDNDRSASRFARRSREDFGKLIADLESDQFNADGLMLWESSRGSRKVGEWVTLLDLLEERHALVYVTTHRRLYDPANPRDRKTLLEDAVDSEYESAKTNLRTKRDTAAAARAGKPHGGAALGFRRLYDPVTRKLVTQEKDPETAPLIRELFDRFVAGHALRAIAADWEARGILNQSGTPYSPAHLRILLLNPAYAGLRLHDPTRRAARSAAAQATATTTKATWDGIVDLSTFLAARDILADPSRKTSRPGRGVHLLSMIVPCDVCSGPLTARHPNDRPGGWVYVCRRGHVRIRKQELDDFATDAILGYLASPNVYMSTLIDRSREELTAARDVVAAVRSELQELARDLGAGRISSTLAAAAEPEKRRRLADAEAREAELSMPSRLAELIQPGEDVAARWPATPMSARREIARIVLSTELLGELRVQRAEYRSQPVEDRVFFHRERWASGR